MKRQRITRQLLDRGRNGDPARDAGEAAQLAVHELRFDLEAAALARPSDQRRDSLASDGIIGTEALRAIHLDAVREVVEPLLSAILRQSASANHSALTLA